MASAKHERLTGVWEQSSPAGSRSRVPVQGSGGEAPLNLKAFRGSDIQSKGQTGLTSMLKMREIVFYCWIRTKLVV